MFPSNTFYLSYQVWTKTNNCRKRKWTENLSNDGYSHKINKNNIYGIDMCGRIPQLWNEVFISLPWVLIRTYTIYLTVFIKSLTQPCTFENIPGALPSTRMDPACTVPTAIPWKFTAGSLLCATRWCRWPGVTLQTWPWPTPSSSRRATTRPTCPHTWWISSRWRPLALTARPAWAARGEASSPRGLPLPARLNRSEYSWSSHAVYRVIVWNRTIFLFE